MSVTIKNYQRIYVTRDYKKRGIVIDEVIETAPNRFKSVKFRHTFYVAGDFLLSEQEAIEFCRDLED